MTRHVIIVCCLCGASLPTGALSQTAQAEPAAEQPAPAVTGKRHVVLVNPLSTGLGLVVSRLIAPTFSANLRYHRALTDRIGLTVAPQLGYTDFLTFHHYLLAVRVGPRISLSRRGLAGWYLTPAAVLGAGWTTQFGDRLQSGVLLGLAVEIGKAWHWRRFSLELGGGLGYSGFVGYSSIQVVEAPAVGFAPILNVSLGYGW